MKSTILFLMAMITTSLGYGQLKTTAVCPSFTVDILGGKVNGLKPSATSGEIKKIFPCFTSSEDEVNTAKCGGTIFYKDKDIYFFTGRDYIEIKEKFKGKLTLPLLGASRTGLFKWLGHPKIKDVNWDAFQTEYGTLVLYYNKGNKINKIQFSTKSSEAMSLCE
ncbi:hypothetical protein CAP36_08035 [Chitinophagaceae bacterium IBVUCB2]|nr:hypothetical protein CAP36_08035 [Chitinophagaceae bacterium IBVUCB2]